MTSDIVDHILTTTREARENSESRVVDVHEQSLNLIIVLLDHLKQFSRTNLLNMLEKQSCRNLITESVDS